MAQLGEKRKKRKGTGAALPVDCCSSDWDKRYQVEEDLRAITRAKAVESDPVRMDLCRKLAVEKLDENKRKREESQSVIDLAEGKNI